MTFQRLLCLFNYMVNKIKYLIDAPNKDLVQKKKTVLKTEYYSYKLGVSHLRVSLLHDIVNKLLHTRGVTTNVGIN